MALASCSDKMDYSETVVKDKDYVIQTFEKVGGFMTDIYNYADYDYGQNFGGGMLASATDGECLLRERYQHRDLL